MSRPTDIMFVASATSTRPFRKSAASGRLWSCHFVGWDAARKARAARLGGSACQTGRWFHFRGADAGESPPAGTHFVFDDAPTSPARAATQNSQAASYGSAGFSGFASPPFHPTPFVPPPMHRWCARAPPDVAALRRDADIGSRILLLGDTVLAKNESRRSGLAAERSRPRGDQTALESGVQPAAPWRLTR